MDNLQKVEKALDLATKSNEVINTSNNSEWYESGQTATTIRDFILDTSSLLGLFSGGFVGSNLPQSYKIPYNTESYKMKKKTEWTDTALPSDDGKTVSSSVVELNQKQLIVEFDISDEFINHSSNPQIMSYITNMAAKSANNSMVNMIVNGDVVTAATGNINSDDQAPATTFTDGAADDSLLLDGLRKAAISNGNTVDVGALDIDDILDIRSKLGKTYMTAVSDVAFITDPYAYTAALKDDTIKLAINTDQSATVDSGMRTSLFGSALVQNGAVPLTEADGKASGATPANNSKGQILAVYRPAFFHGFGSDIKTETVRVPGYGYRIILTMEWGFAIADSTKTVAAGINVTV